MEVRDLVNGTSIAPAAPPDMETIEYFQVVLNTQEVIWAEGAPVETFGGGNLMPGKVGRAGLLPLKSPGEPPAPDC
jgi:hypothetical protein